MARNTAIVVIILAISAALVTGVNFRRPKSPVTAPTSQLSPTPSSVKLEPYRSASCGLVLAYPNTMNVLEGPAGGVVFTSKTDPGNVIIVACQKDIPRPALAPDKIEKLTSGSISATLYHDVSAKDGTPVDKLIFVNPNNGLDIFLSGFGPDFQRMIGNLNLLK